MNSVLPQQPLQYQTVPHHEDIITSGVPQQDSTLSDSESPLPQLPSPESSALLRQQHRQNPSSGLIYGIATSQHFRQRPPLRHHYATQTATKEPRGRSSLFLTVSKHAQPTEKPRQGSHVRSAKSQALTALHDTFTPLIGSGLYNQPHAGAKVAAPIVDPSSTTNWDTTTYGVIVSASQYITGESLGGTAYVDGSALRLTAKHTIPQQVLSITSTLGDAVQTIQFAVALASDNVLHAPNLSVGSLLNSINLGYSSTSLPLQLFGQIGLNVGRNVTIDAADLGLYSGEDQQELAQAHQLTDPYTMRRLELTLSDQLNAALSTGGGSFYSAVLGNCHRSHSRSRTYRTMAKNTDDYNLVLAPTFWQRFIQTRLYSVGLSNVPIHIPAGDNSNGLAELKMGDELLITEQNQYQWNLVAGQLAVWLGFIWPQQQINTKKIHRLDASQCDYALSWTVMRMPLLYLYSPFGPEIDLGIGNSRGMQQTYSVNEADQTPLNIPVPTELGTYQALTAAEALSLRVGIERKALMVHDTWESRIGLGVHLGIVPMNWLPKGWSNTLSAHRASASEVQYRRDEDNQLVRLTTKTVTYTNQYFLWGEYNNVTSVQRCEKPPANQEDPTHSTYQLSEITFTAVLTRSRMGRWGYDQALVAPLNRYFNLKLPKATWQFQMEEREAVVQSTFSVNDLTKLPSIFNRLSGIEIGQVADRTRICLPTLQKLVNTIKNSNDFNQTSQILAHFVGRHGLRGFGAIYSLSSQLPTRISTSGYCSLYDQTQQQTQALELQVTASNNANPNLRYRKKLLDSINDTLKLVNSAEVELKHDAFVEPDYRDTLNDTMVQNSLTLQKLLKQDQATNTGVTQV